ncbi:MAG: DNA-processing protein DprA [Treponema sp.]|jgi:DNA processing protein|nr:DNA-processing protein DprA [Treponema sp.]
MDSGRDTRGLLDLIIARIPRLKPRSRVYLCRKFNNESDFTGLKPHDIEMICAEYGGKTAGRKLSDDTKRWSMDSVVSRAEKDAALMERRGIRWVSITETAYPPLLREIYDPPAALFYRGNLPPPEKTALAIVGTRKSCAAALRWAYETARELSRAGVPVVSGLALGIDAMAHRGVVDAGAVPTFAVLGSSVDEVYPVSNRALARRIMAEGGALLSEYPPETGPARWHYPARNRIISGLCAATIVVEAGEKSGALITADFALEQNRDLYVAGGAEDSGFKENVFGAGCERLAEDGAKVVHNSLDILAFLGLEI